MNLDSTSNLEAAVRSAEGHHKRLCEAFDRGENVTVALSLAHEKLVRVKALLDDATLTTHPADNRTEQQQ